MSEASPATSLLAGRVSLVTGAAKGLGRATAEAFAREGATVYANDRDVSGMAEWAAALATRYEGSVVVAEFDVRDRDAARATMVRIVREHGRLDVLVNNAGIMRDALIGTVTPELMNDVIGVNVVASMELLQLAAKVMVRHGSGSIINLSSIVGLTGNPGQLVYSATKGAIVAMTRTAAKELGPRGIRVNAIAPGMIDTDMMRSVGPDYLQKYVDHTALGRLGRPEEIAEAAVFLASDRSSFITGQTLVVDGCVNV